MPKQNTISLAAQLREFLDYDANTGIFIWKQSPNGRVKVGDKAGSVRKDGYVQFSFAGSKQLAHRLVWLYVHSRWPESQVDHINGVKSDNRLANLREATAHENMQNRLKPRRDNKSGILGVHWSIVKRKWRAEIQIDGATKRLGEFASKEDARQAYLDAKRCLHPFAEQAIFCGAAYSSEEAQVIDNDGAGDQDRTGIIGLGI